MMDLIDRQAAIDAVMDEFKRIPTSAIRAKIRIEALPPAQPEIVRCKDCKHRYVEGMIWHCPFGLMGGENFFCGYGSRGADMKEEDA